MCVFFQRNPTYRFTAAGYETNKHLIFWYVNESLLNVIFQRSSLQGLDYLIVEEMISSGLRIDCSWYATTIVCQRKAEMIRCDITYWKTGSANTWPRLTSLRLSDVTENGSLEYSPQGNKDLMGSWYDCFGKGCFSWRGWSESRDGNLSWCRVFVFKKNIFPRFLLMTSFSNCCKIPCLWSLKFEASCLQLSDRLNWLDLISWKTDWNDVKFINRELWI